MTGIQEPGDVVVLKGGTQHWVRSMGHAINTSWNFGLGTLEQLETAFTRYDINKEVERVDNIVPMKMLLIDYVWDTIMVKKQDFDSDPKLKFFITTKLNEIIKCEINRHQLCQSGDLNNIDCIHKEIDNAKIIFCGEFCPDRELVNIYGYCSSCQQLNNKATSRKKRKQRKYHNVFFCVNCAIEHQKTHPKHVISVSERRAGSFERLIALMGHPKMNCLDDNLLLQLNTKCLKHQDDNLIFSNDGHAEERKEHVNEGGSHSYGIEIDTPPTTTKTTQNNKTFSTSHGDNTHNKRVNGDLDFKRSVVNRLL